MGKVRESLHNDIKTKIHGCTYNVFFFQGKTGLAVSLRWPYHCEPPLDTCKHIELKAKYSLRSKPFILQIRTKIGLILMAVLKL